VIVAERVPVHDGDTVESLRDRVQAVEHRLLPQVVAALVAQ
jgi:folate-dependent phosphoribosylglycinamide formyltransferase PurN